MAGILQPFQIDHRGLRFYSSLEMRYGRPDIIIRNLIGKVQALPPVDDSNLIREV